MPLRVARYPKVRGGRGVYGARLGILMLETRFPRILGDVGNAGTWPFPVLYRAVRGASPDKVVRHRAEGLLEDFKAAAADLVALGADGLTTTCGFLSLFQAELAAHAGVPVATSSLMQVPFVQRLLPPDRRVGVVTISAATLGPDQLAAAGADPETPVVGTDDGREFTRVILGDLPEMDVAAAEQDIIDAGDALMRRHRGIGAVVLECTNMAPFAASLQESIGVPVYDIYSFMTWFHAGLRPRDFGHLPHAVRR